MNFWNHKYEQYEAKNMSKNSDKNILKKISGKYS